MATAESVLGRAIKAGWDAAVGIEPARGKVAYDQLEAVRTAFAALAVAMRGELAAMTAEDRAAAEGTLATVYARGAAVAIAGGDEANAERWLAEAERLSTDDDQRAEIVGARKDHERYRALVHGRNLIAHAHEAAARKAWKTVVARGRADAIGKAAHDELQAPRPLNGASPTLYRLNGCGVGFYGRRDVWGDGSYATTHCVSLLWIPVLPLSAFRVRDSAGGYTLMAREQLSPFARIVRYVIPAVVALVLGGAWFRGYLDNPVRLANNRFDDALTATGEPDAKLAQLDDELARDGATVDAARVERAGAQVVTLAAGAVPKPFTAAALEQGNRVVRRFHALPLRAQQGEAQTIMLGLLDDWQHQLGDSLATADARLALLRAEAPIADGARLAAITAQISATRLAVADAQAPDWPLDALAALVEDTHDAAAMAAATKIVARLVESPSLLLDAGGDLDAWLAAQPTGDALAAKVVETRLDADAERTATLADGVTAKQLLAMQVARPNDQLVALQLARDEASTGKLDAAVARLTKLGAPGWMIREARITLGQLLLATGKLEQADAMLTSLLGARLARFAAANAGLNDAVKAVRTRIAAQFDANDIPAGLRAQVEHVPEDEAKGLIDTWVNEQIDGDPDVTRLHATFEALGDVVPVSIALGSAKLRRAQALTGSARNAMLEDAEHAFLAIQSEGEGQPEFQLGLGEIYARLGKTKESDAEFDAVIAKHDPALSLQVANVYRDIGNIARAKQLATSLYDSSAAPTKDGAAVLLALMATDDEDAESWYRKADQTQPFVKTSLLELEGSRLLRAGKRGECAEKFAAVAKAYLASASAANRSGYNNAANADEQRYACSGDPQALRDAEIAQEQAYKTMSDDPIVVGNLARMLEGHGWLRVLGKRVDVRALRLTHGDVDTVLAELARGSERAAVLAELAAEPSVRRSAELNAQYEVLAPNSSLSYETQFTAAELRDDATTAAAVLARAKAARLDVSEAARQRGLWTSGASDEHFFADNGAALARLDDALAQPKLDAKTRAVALYLQGQALWKAGLYKPDPAKLAHAGDALRGALKLWPALDTNRDLASLAIDQAGVAADASAWVTLRRSRSAPAAAAKWIADGSSSVAAMRAAPAWGDIAGFARASATKPGIADLRIARLLGDAALETRANAAFADVVLHLSRELQAVIDPTDPVPPEDLALLDKK